MRKNWVYMMSNKRNGTLYIGSTSNLTLRVSQHKSGTGSQFTEKYGLTKLVWFEAFGDYETALTQERRMKKWRRQWKLDLINKNNPQWQDLRPY